MSDGDMATSAVPAAVTGQSESISMDPFVCRLLGAIVGVALYLVLVLANRDLLAAEVAQWGDTAANSLLIDEALRGELLVGHYSRGGFNHPGPVFLYAQAGGELLFHRWASVAQSAYGGWVLGAAAINCALLGWVTSAALRRTASFATSLTFPLLALLINAWEPSVFTSDWGPALIVVPYLAALVAGSLVAARSYWALSLLVTASGFMLHGHLSSLVFVGALWATVLFIAWRTRRSTDSWTAPTKREWIPAITVGTLFALPLLLHIVTDWPGEIGKYLTYARGEGGGASGTLFEALEYAGRAVLHGPFQIAALGSAVLAGAWMWSRSRRTEPPVSDRQAATSALLSASAWVLAVQTLLFAVYCWRVVDDLELGYLAWFALALPTSILWLGTTVADEVARSRLTHRTYTWVSVLSLTALSLLCAVTVELGNTTRGEPVLEQLVPIVAKEPTRLRFEQSSWPMAVGVLAGSERVGGDTCVEDETWAFMVTDDLICSTDDERRTVIVSTGQLPPPSPDEVFRDQSAVLVVRR